MLDNYVSYLKKNGLVVDLIAHISIPIIISVPTGTLLAFRLFYVNGGLDDLEHIKGPCLYTGKPAFSHASSHFKKEVKSKDRGNSIALHPKVKISLTRELGNLFVYGQQGSGKSVVLKPIISQVLQRGDRAVIYDQKREYTTIFGGPNAILISPTDKRGYAWDVGQDVKTIEQAESLAECFIISKGEEAEFWYRGARSILTGCIVACIHESGQWGWSDLRNMLNKPILEMRSAVESCYPDCLKCLEVDSKGTQSFMTILGTELGWLNHLSKAWASNQKKRFSVTGWVKGNNRKNVLLIPNDPLHSTISGPLCNAIITLLSKHILSLNDSRSRRIWYCLDELGNLPRCEALFSIMTLGRSKGVRVLAGTQTTSQLETIYGSKGAETLLALFANVVCLRLGAAGQSACQASHTFGKRTVIDKVESFDDKGQRSVSRQRKDVLVVTPEQIVHLPQSGRDGVHGFLSVAGWEGVYKLTWPIISLEKKARAYVPADWLTQSAGKSQGRRLRRGSRVEC